MSHLTRSSLPDINSTQRSFSQLISSQKKTMQTSLSPAKFKLLKMESTNTAFRPYQNNDIISESPILLQNGRSISLSFKSRVPTFKSTDLDNVKKKLTVKKPEPEQPSSRELSYLSRQQQLSKPIHSKRVDQNAQMQFYDYYRNMEQIRQQEKSKDEGQSPFHTILRFITMFNLPPKTYEFIKQKGNEKVLCFERMGMGRNPALLMIASVIETLQNFNFLNLSENDIGPDAACQIIKKIRSIKQIDFSFNFIGMAGIMELSKTFRTQQCRIRSLSLQKNGLTDKSLKMLIDALRNNKMIKKLNISQNMIALPTCLSLKSLLFETQELQQLYLHWCDLDKACGQAIFQGLTPNKTLKVMDLSWNKIGDHPPSLTLLTTIFQGNTNLAHVDLCFCQYTFEESKAISESLEQNNTMTGFHFQGNYGYINHKGFLIIEQKKKKKFQQYPAPLKFKTSIRRIHATDYQKETDAQRQMVGNGSDICWICMGWQQVYFRIQKKGEDEEHFLHLSAEGFIGVKMIEKEDWVQLSRIVPIGKLDFFFTLGKEITNRFTVQSYPSVQQDKQVNLKKGEIIFQNIHLTKVNSIQVQKKCQIYNEYFEYLFKTPIRSKDLKMIGKKGFNFANSYFKNWKLQTKKLLEECWNYDVKNSKITKVLKKQTDFNDVSKVVKDNYQIIRNVYTNFASKEISSENMYGISSLAALGFGRDFGIINKKFPEALYTIKFITSLTKQGQKLNDPNKLMTRSSFIQFLIRIAEQKYVRGKFVDKEGNQIKYTYAQGLKKVVQKLSTYDSVYNFTNWRTNRYWNEDIDKLLKIFRGFLEKLFEKYAGSKIKIKRKGEKPPISLFEFKQIFTDCKLNINNQTDYDLNLCYDLSRMLTFQQADFVRRINLLEFTQAIARFADKRQFFPIGYTVDTFSDYQISVLPLSMRLEGLLFKLLEANRDLSNPRTDRYTRKSLFTQQIIEFQSVTNRLAQFNETQNEQFVSFLKQNSKVRINSSQERKIETSQQISQLKFELDRQQRVKLEARKKQKKIAMEKERQQKQRELARLRNEFPSRDQTN